jgi:hypothetical protein
MVHSRNKWRRRIPWGRACRRASGAGVAGERDRRWWRSRESERREEGNIEEEEESSRR